MPELVPPMLAAPGPLPDGGDWVVEFAWEGLRCLAHVRPDRARLRTVNGRDVTSSFPELVEPLTRRAPRGGMVLDGTVVAVGEGGLPRRRLLQRRTAAARPSAAVLRRTPVALIVGDLLWVAGRDLATLPYHRRRELLEELGISGPPVVVSPTFPVAEAAAVMRTAEEYGAEALHARHLDAPYKAGPAAAVLGAGPVAPVGAGGRRRLDADGPAPAGSASVRCCSVCPTPSRTGGCATWAGPGSGRGRSSGRSRHSWPGCAAPTRRSARRCPPAVGRDAQWAEPRLVGRVEFTDWTADGRLRLPAWRGLLPRGEDARRPLLRPPDAPADPVAGAPVVPRQESRTAPPEPAQDIGPAAVRATEARRLEQHFVYNALNTIAALMRTDPARARELLLGFADLNRAADRPDGIPGTLGDELVAVRAYLQLEQARFGPRLQVEIAVDEELHALPMAPRKVLDAVRAVVQQRIEPRPGGGTVTVTAERAGAGCLVRIGERDGDGRGGEPMVVAPA